LSHVLATPFDVVKTKQQAEEDTSGERLGMLQMGWRIIRKDGPSKLLSGAGATFCGYFFHGAFKYGLFELWKQALRVGYAALALRIPLLCLSAFLAELLATVVLCPAEAARVILVTDPGYVEPTRQAYRELCQKNRGIHLITSLFGANTWLALHQLRKDQGVLLGWFGALVPLLAKQCSYTVAKLVTYDVLRSVLCQEFSPVLARLLAAFGAAAAATVASQPADTIFTCISLDGGGECPIDFDSEEIWDDEPPSIWKQMQDATRRLGVTGLFSGWRTRICQMTLVVVMQLLIYDSIRP